jgi:hypothetical protein
MTSTLRPSLRDGSSLHRYPGTSCLATISLSLRDKYICRAEALIKLALMGLSPAAPKVGQKFPDAIFCKCQTPAAAGRKSLR